MSILPHPSNDKDKQYNECERKLKYDTYRIANREAIRLRKVHKNRRLRAYSCHYCDGYHIGSHNLPIKRRNQE